MNDQNVVDIVIARQQREHGMAMLLAQEHERARCMRIVARWQDFAASHGASFETIDILTKIGLEIFSDSDPWRN